METGCKGIAEYGGQSEGRVKRLQVHCTYFLDRIYICGDGKNECVTYCV